MSKTTFRKKFLDLIMTEENFKEAFPENVDVSGEIPIAIKKQIKEAFNLPTDDCDIILKLYEENGQLKAQIEKMKTCFNCDKPIKHLDCGDCHNGSNWELAQSDKLIRG